MENDNRMRSRRIAKNKHALSHAASHHPIRFQISTVAFLLNYCLIKISRRHRDVCNAIHTTSQYPIGAFIYLSRRRTPCISADPVNISRTYLRMHRRGIKINFRIFQRGLIEFAGKFCGEIARTVFPRVAAKHVFCVVIGDSGVPVIFLRQVPRRTWLIFGEIFVKLY